MKDDKILEIFRESLSEVSSSYSDQYQEMSDDLEFAGGNQYTEDEEKARGTRPCVVINQTKTIIDDIVNPVRLNPFGVLVDGDEALQDHIRFIEHESNASEAYELGLENAVITGRGFIKVKTEYEKKDGLDQKVRIMSIRNPLGIYLDPFSVAIDGSDANYALELAFINKKRAIREYGEDAEADVSELYSGWVVPEESIPCVNFYVKMPKKEKHTYVNGVEIEGELSDEEYGMLVSQGARVQTKTTSEDEWHVFKIIGQKVVDKTKLPILPIVPVYGDRVFDKERLNCYKGVVHVARPVQKMINYYASQEMEISSLAPKSPFVGSAEAVNGYQHLWQTANTEPHSILIHNQFDDEGRPLAPPQRADNTAQTQHIIASRMKAQQDLEALFGRNPMNQVAGQDSGKAVFLKEQQSEVNTAQYTDNLKKSIRRVGEIIIALMYSVYDTERELGFRNEDGENRYEKADLSRAGFDKKDINISVSAGVAYESRRKEAISLSLEAMRMAPQMFPNFADLFYKQIDSPVAKEFADRAYRMLPPELQDEGEADPKALQALRQAEQTIAEAQAQAEEIQNQLQTAYRVIDQLQVLHERNIAELKSENDIATQNNVTKILIEYMKQEGKSEEQARNLSADLLKTVIGLEGTVEDPQIDLQSVSPPPMSSGVAGGSQVPEGVVLNEEMPQ